MEKREIKQNITSWKDFEVLQQPSWPDQSDYKAVIKKLYSYPPIILFDRVNKLKTRLEQVADNKAFLIQGGDCAESFKEFSEDNIKNKLKILFQMSTIISYGASIDTVKIGRIAGQYAKPRTSNFETRNDITLPTYRGDSVNDISFELRSRTPNPKRLLEAYNKSTSTVNLIQPIIKNEFKELKQF